MKPYHLLTILLTVLAALSCRKQSNESLSEGNGDQTSEAELGHDMIVLGRQLDNPYTLTNVRAACKSLCPTKSYDGLRATDLYVRFLPGDDDELDLLKSLGVTMLDHPVDYEILKEGDYYRDPEIPEEQITWQYAVVPVDFTFPDIQYEILDECYLADSGESSKALSDLNWADVEAESFRLTGNEEMLDPGTRGSAVQPQGRIAIVDSEVAGGKPVGVRGVKVECNVFIKFSSTYTDDDGYYTIPKRFSARPRYRLVFVNSRGFTIGFNTILYRGSISSLGRGVSSGIDVTVDETSDSKLFKRCVVTNTARDFYDRCAISDLDIQEPPSNLCFWIFDSDASSAVMLHHGTILEGKSNNIWFKLVAWIVKFFGPDITLGLKDVSSYREIYSFTVHEMAHASHFAKVGLEYWNEYIAYISRCALKGLDLYGSASETGSGRCAVGEMWAYYMQNKLCMERYGGENPGYGIGYWFHPQILATLEDRGLSSSQIFDAMTENVTDMSLLKAKLLELYPSKRTVINQVFNRYE